MKIRSDNLVWGGSATITALSCLVVSLCLISSCRAALTTAEKNALAQILQNYPDLSIVPVWASTDREGTYFGKKWTNNFEEVCLSPGYDLFGVHCSEQGHVDGLNIMSYWGYPISSNFDAVSGLTHLTNITLGAQATSCVLAETVINRIPQLQTAIIPDLIPTTELSHPGLTHLEATEHQNLQFSNFSNLRQLKAVRVYTNITTIAGPFRTTMESLSFDRSEVDVYISDVDSLDFASWPQLKYLKLSRLTQNPTVVVEVLNLHTDNLEHLELEFFSQVNVSISSRSLSFFRPGSDVPTDLNCPNLRLLQLHSKVNFGSLPLLEELEVIVSNSADFTSLSSLASSLKNVKVVGPVSIETICSLMGSTLESIDYVGDSFSTPACLLQATSLKKVRLNPGPNFVMSDLSNIPTTITELNLRMGSFSGLPCTELFRFPSLQRIHIVGCGGELPSDFFVRFPQLTSVELDSKDITGAIPSLGWQNLETVSIDGSISSFPGIEGTASHLKTLNIHVDDNEVEIIPTDQMMLAAQLSELSQLEYKFRARGPIPTFWTDLPKIRSVHIRCDLYSGPLPRSIGAPSLRTLELSQPANLCGPLFDFEVFTTLSYLHLKRSLVSGPFPSSWSSNLKIFYKVDLSNNFLTGPLPQNWFTTQTSGVLFENNPGLTGPFEFGLHSGNLAISLSNTSVSLCGPPLPSAPTATGDNMCRFENLACPSSGACLDFWTSFCVGNLACGGTPPPYVAPPTCTTPPTTAPTPVAHSMSSIEVSLSAMGLSLTLCIMLVFVQ